MKCLCLLCSGQTDTIKHAAYLAHLGNNPARILKAVVDLLKQRYLAKEYTPLGVEDILQAISLQELKTDTRQWLESVSQTTMVFTNANSLATNTLDLYICVCVSDPECWLA